ncbi:unnamed protein product [Caenorhabditis angaria]|uniref:BHLH domain-containing protein n=1 Tax=Caenorhabditis angaria TaxID=860376 RepID=A0A9P1IZN3_9PELO|nr:unnamed protein product [Caenorhabditis angaria]
MSSSSSSNYSYDNLTWEQFEEYHNPLRNFNRPDRVSSTASSAHSSTPSQSPTDFEVPQFTYDEQQLSSGGGKAQRCKVPSAQLVQERRSAANERERKRVNTMNAAYDQLRQVLPNGGNSDKKLSKFETLQMAQRYIAHLQQLLRQSDSPSQSNSSSELSSPSDIELDEIFQQYNC